MAFKDYQYCLTCLSYVKLNEPHSYRGTLTVCIESAALDLSVLKPRGEWPKTSLDKWPCYNETETDLMDEHND
jgi:hypothetical protein